MNQDLTNNEKVPMEKLFQEALQEHREPVDEKDFDQFMDQLEDTGFFIGDNSKTGFLNSTNNNLYKFLFSGSILTGLLIAGYFMLRTTDSNVKVPSEQKADPIETITESNSDDNSNSKTKASTSASLKKNSHSVNTHVSKDKNETQTSLVNTNTNLLTVSDLNNSVKDISLVKDSIPSNVISNSKKLTRDSVRVRYVMAIDTVKTVDTTNIRKKKYQRMKGKNN